MWMEWEARDPGVEVNPQASVTGTRSCPWCPGRCPPPQVEPHRAQGAPASLICSPSLASRME